MLPSLNDFILKHTPFKTILFLDELSQNRKKSRKILPKLKGLGTSVYIQYQMYVVPMDEGEYFIY